MSGPPPNTVRRRRNTPARGDWQKTPKAGWQHGAIPATPDGLKDESLWAWQTWFHAWFAAHWTEDDLPGLRVLIRLYDEVDRGGAKAADRSELRQLMDNYGITPKGQQDRRWTRPKPEEAAPSSPQRRAAAGKYAHLKVMGEE